MTSQHTAQAKTSQATQPTAYTPTTQKSATQNHPMLHLQRQVGNQAATSIIQAKLTVGEPNDVYEQEADRVAAEVVRKIHSPTQSTAQRKAQPTPQIQPLVQRKGDTEGMAVSLEVEAGIQQARGGGQMLDENIRVPMEQAFGADFSGVRVHTGGESDRLNHSVQARAFTTGQDIFFSQGSYEPSSQSGQELIAHELTHVTQQNQSVTDRTKQVQLEVDPNLRTTVSGDVPIIQCAPAWTRQKDNELNDFVNRLDKLVNDTAQFIIENPLTIPEPDGYVKRWKLILASFAHEVAKTGDLKHALKTEPFIYAAYGYAVESITNIRVEEIKDALPSNTIIAVQATRGHTRPDIVIKQKGVSEESSTTDVGWFDITASDSETHIQSKTGSSWVTRPYVAEVTYPSLTEENLTKLAKTALEGAGKLSKEELEKLGELVKEQKKHQQEQLIKAAELVLLVIKQIQNITNMTEKKTAFETKLAEVLGVKGKLTPRRAKGWITLVWPNLGDSYSSVAGLAGYKGTYKNNPDTETAKEEIYGLEV